MEDLGCPSPLLSNPLKVMRTGFVEKENPQRPHSYRRRFFVLTTDAVYWFQKNNDNELVGQEKGRLRLLQIFLVDQCVENKCEFELRSTDEKKTVSRRLFKCSSEAECLAWVVAVKAVLSDRSVTATASSTDEQEADPASAPDDPLGDGLGQQRVTVVSVRSVVDPTQVTGPCQDVILYRNPEKDEWLSLFDMQSIDELVVTVSTGGYAVIPRASLESNGVGAVGEFTVPLLDTPAYYLESRRPGMGRSKAGGATRNVIANGSTAVLASVQQRHVRIQVRSREGEGRRRGSSLPVIVRSKDGGSGSDGALGQTGDSLHALGSLLLLVLMAGTLFRELWGRGAVGVVTSLGPTVLVAVGLSVLLAGSSVCTWLQSRLTNKTEKTLSFAVRVRVEASSSTAALGTGGVGGGPTRQHGTSGSESCTDSDNIPERYLAACDYDVEAAQRMWDVSRMWRTTEHIDRILFEKQPHFKLIKELYPHYMCGRGKKGQVVYYERPGHIKVQEMRNSGITPDLLVRHYVFTTEFQWEISAPRKDHQSISVLDLDGVNMGMLTATDIVESLRRIVSLGSLHYPERSFAVYIVNAPSWYSFCWKIVKHLVSEKTQNKMKILSKKETLAGLMEHVDLDEIPVYYGGRKNYGGDIDSCRFQSEDELEMADWVDRLNGSNPPTQADLVAQAHTHGGPSPGSPPSVAESLRMAKLQGAATAEHRHRYILSNYASSDVDEGGSLTQSSLSSLASSMTCDSARCSSTPVITAVRHDSTGSSTKSFSMSALRTSVLSALNRSSRSERDL